MSAWIVTNESLSKIVNSFYWRKNNEHLRGKLKDKFGVSFESWEDEETDKNLKKFGQLLADLNNNSVNQRYDEHNEAIEFKLLNEKTDIYQFLKSVECLIYQSCEGDCEETELYKFLIELENSLRSEIIGKIDGYNKAKWE